MAQQNTELPPAYVAGVTSAVTGRYKVVTSPSINILLVGRSQTGKSTIIQTLLKPSEGRYRTGYSQTQDPEFHTLTVTDCEKGKQYQLNIIDTPGLEEHRKDGASRTDEELLSLSIRCMRHNITRLHVVCFVSEAGRTQLIDLQPFDKIVKFLGDKFKNISVMVLTNAENVSEKGIAKYAKDISEDNDAKFYYEFCARGIFPMGCVDMETLAAQKEDGATDQEIEMHKNRLVRKVDKMRENLLTLFVESKDEIVIGELEAIRNKQEEEMKKNFKLSSVSGGGFWSKLTGR